MSKPHRGKSIRELPYHGRGKCPICERSGVKILFEQDSGEGKIKICKTCKAAIKNGKKAVTVTASVASAPVAAAAAPAAATPAPAAPAPEVEAAPAADASADAPVAEAAVVETEAETETEE